MPRVIVHLVVVSLVVLGAGAARATTVLRMPLARVAGESARIVHAEVVDVRSGRDTHGTPATWVTLAVARSLKGGKARRVVFKQYGVAAPLADGTITRIPGLPQWQPGDEAVVFLRGESLRGFTSPVGLGQGVYRVRRSGGRARIFAAVPRALAAEAPEDLDEFLAKVKMLVEGGR
jgi:hypothetical protein